MANVGDDVRVGDGYGERLNVKLELAAVVGADRRCLVEEKFFLRKRRSKI